MKKITKFITDFIIIIILTALMVTMLIFWQQFRYYFFSGYSIDEAKEMLSGALGFYIRQSIVFTGCCMLLNTPLIIICSFIRRRLVRLPVIMLISAAVITAFILCNLKITF